MQPALIFKSHIKYFGSHIPIVPTKFWNNCNLLGGLTTQAQHWILTLYLQIFLWLTNIQIWILDIAIWCNPAQNLQLKRFCQKPGTSLFASNILWLCVFWVHTYLYMYINEPTKFWNTDKCSFRKQQTDKHFKKKKQHAVFRSLASKNESANFSKKQTNAVLKEKNERANITTTNIYRVWRKNKRTNISKNRQMKTAGP